MCDKKTAFRGGDHRKQKQLHNRWFSNENGNGNLWIFNLNVLTLFLCTIFDKLMMIMCDQKTAFRGGDHRKQKQLHNRWFSNENGNGNLWIFNLNVLTLFLCTIFDKLMMIMCDQKNSFSRR